ncbi:hypothetical protein CR513_23790, partial [Mucuna pruriens]
MGRGAAIGTLVGSHHTKIDYLRNLILLHFWNRCYDLGRGVGVVTKCFTQCDDNEEELKENLDLLQEEREMAHICEYAAKARVGKRYNSMVFPRPLQKGDLGPQGATTNKLTPNWERPFRVREDVKQGAFGLEQLDRKLVPHTWNIAIMRKYYNVKAMYVMINIKTRERQSVEDCPGH